MTDTSTRFLRYEELALDGSPQVRLCRLDEATVERYADAVRKGEKLPPGVVFAGPEDGRLYLADGRHRVEGGISAGKNGADFEVRQGTYRDALAYALAANDAHGLPRTDADKRNAVEIALKDEEWGKWSDNAVARLCAVSQPFVGKVRASLKTAVSETAPTRRTYRTKHGTVATMETDGIGKGRTATKAARPSRRAEKGAPAAAAQAPFLGYDDQEGRLKLIKEIAQGLSPEMRAELKRWVLEALE
jgi:hypothetical protein